MSDASDQSSKTVSKRGRGRPRKDSNWTAFSREDLAERALLIAGHEGFPAVTMHRLAAEFEVTPRALYNYVTDRQEIINMAVDLFLNKPPLIEFDPKNWREGVRRAYCEARKIHRAFPRAALMSLDEKIDVQIGPRRTQLMERLLQFYVDINLPLKSAVTLAHALEQDVLGFGLHFDYVYDQLPEGQKDFVTRVVPEVWLNEDPQANAPISRQALELPEQTSDELFADLVELRILAIESLLATNIATS